MYLAPLVLLIAIAVAVGYVRLRHGPISLQSFAPSIERGIAGAFPGMTAKIDDAALVLADHGGLEFRLSNLKLSESDGDLVASAPAATVELNMNGLWSLRAVPTRVFLIEPRLSLIYSQAGGLALSFSAPGEASDDAAKQAAGELLGEKSGLSPKPDDAAGSAKFGQVDVARIIAESAARARRGEDATSDLNEIGVKNAIVVLEYEGQRSEWRVPEAAIDLDHHKRRSVVSGSAKVISDSGPWALSFRAEDKEKSGTVNLQASVRELVPSTLAKSFPALPFLQALALPLSGDAEMMLSNTGIVQDATLALELGAGRIVATSLGKGGSSIDAGLLKFQYDGPGRRLNLLPSTIRSGASFLTLSGVMAASAGEAQSPEWTFDIKSSDGMAAAEEFGVAGIKIESFLAGGTFVPKDGLVRLAQLSMKAGEAQVSAEGEFQSGAGGPRARFDGKMSPMPLDTFKAIWPRALAPAAREWAGKNLKRAKLKSGTVKYASGPDPWAETGSPAPAADRLSVASEIADLQAVPAPGAAPFEAPRLLVRLEGDALEVNIPEATIVAAPSRVVSLKGGRFTAVNVLGPEPVGEVAFRVLSPLSSALAVVSRPPFALMRDGDLPIEGIEGKVDGQFKVTMPLGASTPSAPLAVEGKARVSDIKSKQKIGPVDVQGGTINVDVTAAAAEAKGDLLLNGVLINISGQRIFDAAPDQQPPLRLTAILDNADRNQLGLDVNHIVQGEMPIDVAVTRAPNGAPAIHVRADLTGADLGFEDIAWKKPSGRSAVLDFDVASSQANPFELHNIKMAGDNIAIEGWAAINAQNDLKEFFFPDFSLNVVSRLEVQGKLGNDRVWRVKARGSTYDGKDIFTQLVSLGGGQSKSIKPLRPAAGVDLDAEITNVLGHNETSLRGVKLNFSERSDKLTALKVDGTLDGGKPFAALLKQEPAGPRLLYADSTDAGQAFKLVNFYPNVQGGRVRLEVNLDGKGDADRTGVLWVDNFRVLGDPVISEVVSSAEGGASQGKQKVVREIFDFDQMRVPFSAGYEQFVLGDSAVRGPVVGATISGKVDFKSRQLSLGGTYIPLQGINSALCAIPLIGLIVTGPKCEGIVGITYAIQGSMSRPQVLVNPLSMLTPGIFREIMTMTNPNQKVQARGDSRAKVPVGARVGNSSSEAVRAEAAAKAQAGRANTQTIDPWSSQSTGPQKK